MLIQKSLFIVVLTLVSTLALAVPPAGVNPVSYLQGSAEFVQLGAQLKAEVVKIEQAVETEELMTLLDKTRCAPSLMSKSLNIFKVTYDTKTYAYFATTPSSDTVYMLCR